MYLYLSYQLDLRYSTNLKENSKGESIVDLALKTHIVSNQIPTRETAATNQSAIDPAFRGLVIS